MVVTVRTVMIVRIKMMILILSMQPQIRLTITYEVCISISGGASSGRVPSIFGNGAAKFNSVVNLTGGVIVGDYKVCLISDLDEEVDPCHHHGHVVQDGRDVPETKMSSKTQKYHSIHKC